jgi:hypothetical protein
MYQISPFYLNHSSCIIFSLRLLSSICVLGREERVAGGAQESLFTHVNYCLKKGVGRLEGCRRVS